MNTRIWLRNVTGLSGAVWWVAAAGIFLGGGTSPDAVGETANVFRVERGTVLLYEPVTEVGPDSWSLGGVGSDALVRTMVDGLLDGGAGGLAALGISFGGVLDIGATLQTTGAKTLRLGGGTIRMEADGELRLTGANPDNETTIAGSGSTEPSWIDPDGMGTLRLDAPLTRIEPQNGTDIWIHAALVGDQPVRVSGTNDLILGGHRSNAHVGWMRVGGSGALRLGKTGGAIAVAGDLRIETGGRVVLENSGQFADGVDVELAGGTFQLNGHSDEIGSLSLGGGGAIDFAGGPATLLVRDAFVDDGGVIVISNWSGSFSGGGDHQLLFGFNPTEFVTQLGNRLVFDGYDHGYHVIERGGGIFEIAAAPEGTVYHHWAYARQLDPESDGAPRADPDGDGVPNILEFAFGTDPRVATPRPTPEVIDSWLVLPYTRALVAAEMVDIVAERASDLAGPWTETDVEDLLVGVTDGIESRIARTPVEGERGFLRLRAESAHAARTLFHWTWEGSDGTPGSSGTWWHDKSGNGLHMGVVGSGSPGRHLLPEAGPGSTFPNPIPRTGDSNTHGLDVSGGWLRTVLTPLFFRNSFTVETFFNIPDPTTESRFFALQGSKQQANGYVAGGTLRVRVYNPNGDFVTGFSPVDSGLVVESGKDYYVAVAVSTGANATDRFVDFYLKNLTDGGSLRYTRVSIDDMFTGLWAGGNVAFRVGSVGTFSAIGEVRYSDGIVPRSNLLISPRIDW